MFGLYTISSTVNGGSYKNESTTRPSSQNTTKSTGSYSNIAKQKKVKNEELQKQLEQEQREYEATLQGLLDDQQYAYEDQYAMDPVTMQLNLAFIATTKGYKHGHRYNQVKGSFDAASVNFNKNNNAVSFNSLQAKGLKYSSAKGQKLAKDMANHSVGFTGHCSRYVREGLQRTGLYNGHTASAYQMGGILAKNKNFQEVSPNSVNLKDLPAGCILVYDKNTKKYSNKHGHIEVTLGDGTACSDGRTRNIYNTNNMRIFVPTENV